MRVRKQTNLLPSYMDAEFEPGYALGKDSKATLRTHAVAQPQRLLSSRLGGGFQEISYVVELC